MDYVDKLNAEEKAFLAEFTDEYYQGNAKSGYAPEGGARCRRARRDAYAREKRHVSPVYATSEVATEEAGAAAARIDVGRKLHYMVEKTKATRKRKPKKKANKGEVPVLMLEIYVSNEIMKGGKYRVTYKDVVCFEGEGHMLREILADLTVKSFHGELDRQVRKAAGK